MSCFQSSVGIPRPGSAIGAMEDLHESDSLFHESSRRQALLREGFGGGIIQSVGVLNGLRLLSEINDVGDCRLHTKRQLIRLDPRRKCLIVGILDGRNSAQAAEKVEFSGLLFTVDIGSW